MKLTPPKKSPFRFQLFGSTRLNWTLCQFPFPILILAAPGWFRPSGAWIVDQESLSRSMIDGTVKKTCIIGRSFNYQGIAEMIMIFFLLSSGRLSGKMKEIESHKKKCPLLKNG
jgi:hypothetical protein